MKIPLFDIDWTLLDKDPKRNIHHEAFLYAYDKVYGVSNPKEIDVEGKLDNQIIVETMQFNGISAEEVRQKLPSAFEAMKKYFFEHINEGTVHVLPGVRELLESLKERGVSYGLLTGNVEAIGWAKLKQAGIRDFFGFGGFGDKGEKRADLIGIAKDQAEKALNRKIEVEDFVIIGDTPLDIACAKTGGIKCIAVASGLYSFEVLVSKGADLVVKSLEEKEKILNFLQNQETLYSSI